VHGDLTTLVGGVRALFLQALHPAAMAGVAQHSRYASAPLDRLAGTTRWLVTTTFGSTALAQQEAARVRGMHGRVVGTVAIDGQDRAYAADDPDLLAWVHAAFTDSFLVAHEVFGDPAPDVADTYVGEWAEAAVLLGADDPPRSRSGLDDALSAFAPELRGGADVERTVRFLLAPPLPLVARPAYSALVAGALTTLPADTLALLGLKAPPTVPTHAAVRALLGTLSWGLGPMSPAEELARARIARLDDRPAAS
jgi:uncharacterized protein (DUF2236 family)